MSRFYEMQISITGEAHFSEEERALFESVVENEWPTTEDDVVREHEHTLSISVRNNLCGGETEDEFAARIAHATWAALGRYVDVSVVATDLENVPCETYNLGEEDYTRFKAAPEIV